MSIIDWPKQERPREKMLLRGAAALSDAELLAIFLRTGVKGKTAVDFARELLSEFGSLRALLQAGRERFCVAHGLGVAKYVQLQATLEMSRRHLAERLQSGEALANTTDTRLYLMARLRNHPHEVFACLFLDNRHRVISFDEMFHGTINGASVYPREVVKRTLQHNAAAVIFAHNHPSGVAEPSRTDRVLTDKLKQALELIDVRVLDHVVVGEAECVSFAERGWL